MEEQMDKKVEEQTEDPKDIQENKLIAALSYLGILVLIPLLAKKESKFAQFHAKQGVVMLIIFVVLSIFSVIPLIGWILGPIATFLLAIVDLIAIIQALSGKYWEIPVVSEWAKKIKL